MSPWRCTSSVGEIGVQLRDRPQDCRRAGCHPEAGAVFAVVRAAVADGEQGCEVWRLFGAGIARTRLRAFALSDRYGGADHLGAHSVFDDRFGVGDPIQGCRNVGLHGVALLGADLIDAPVAVSDESGLGDPAERCFTQGGHVGDFNRHFSGMHPLSLVLARSHSAAP